MASSRIASFNFKPGTVVDRTFAIERLLGRGWESEVYLVKEIDTNILRAAKFFFPHRNTDDRAAKRYSLKLHKLKNIPEVMDYLALRKTRHSGETITYILSEYIEGEILTKFLNSQPGKRLNQFTAVHLLYSIVSTLDAIHQLGEYHGDLHSDNIIIQGFGLHFQLKLLDMYYQKGRIKANCDFDITNSIRIFYDALGGKRTYSKQPEEIKYIVSGLKHTQILKKFPTAADLKYYLENLRWSEA